MAERRKGFLDGRTWLRGLVMLLFVLIYGVAELVLAATALFQFGFVLFSGRHSEPLRRFGQSLATYVYQLIRFWTFNSEDRPFPFADWPGAEG